jgi:hypothetical protein
LSVNYWSDILYSSNIEEKIEVQLGQYTHHATYRLQKIKACYSLAIEILCNILTEFRIPTKLARPEVPKQGGAVGPLGRMGVVCTRDIYFERNIAAK